LLELVGDGTLVIKDVGRIERTLHDVLLVIMEEGRFTPGDGGADGAPAEPQPFTGRLIFTSEADLRRAVREGRLSSEFYQHLATTLIELPTLAERRGDIPLLIEHFVQLAATRLGVDPAPAPAAFIEACTQDAWPAANVRELRGVVERALSSARTPEGWLAAYREHAAQRPDAELGVAAVSYQERLREFERAEISRALRAVNWNQAAAARLLSMAEATLRYKVKTLGIRIQH
jgi:two-component system NtrC family response regulator